MRYAMKFNRQMWDEKRLEIEKQIRDLKHAIRKEPRPMKYWDNDCSKVGTKLACFGTFEEYKLLGSLKSNATYMYTIRALARDKLHAHRTVTHKDDGTKVVTEHTLDEEKARMWGAVEDYLLPDELDVDISTDADSPSGSFC